MGLYVHSLSRLPVDMERDYFLYVLDYGWEEPLGAALHNNFRKMAELAAKNKALVVAGTDPATFVDEIISMHVDNAQFSFNSINGLPGDDVLPALMITSIHPAKFKEINPDYKLPKQGLGFADDKLILIPLRGVCENSTDVIRVR